jgi:branched-chain amino acid aminotransferase
MNECFGNSFIRNGELVPSVHFDNSLVYEGDSVYEVIRMVKGKPVFFNDHIERLEKSVRFQQRNMVAGADTLCLDILKLTESEKRKEVNLKIIFNYKNSETNYLVYLIKPIYPTKGQYINGVKGILFHAERKDPESKVINHKLRSEIYHKLILEGAYEALLVDRENRITEGSRSNIFFIRGGVLYTAPESVILNGITRKYILDICNEQGIKVVFECVKADEIDNYESSFMSGTSPTILPFRCIDNSFFNARLRLMTELRKLYMRKAEESIIRFSTE